MEETIGLVDNIKVDIRITGCKNVGHERAQWRAIAHTVTNFRTPLKINKCLDWLNEYQLLKVNPAAWN